jgi:hypothetical protein
MSEEIVKIRFVSCEELHKMAIEEGYPPYVRGWAKIKANEVIVCKEHFDGQLIGHEVLHTQVGGGRGHTFLPTIMNPSGAFRWFGSPIRSIIKIIWHMRRKPG